MNEDDAGDRIVVLKGLDPIRMRPAMYIGDPRDREATHRLIWEVAGNVVDQHLARNATELRVEIAADSWVTVQDDDPGISVGVNPRLRDRTVLETVFTTLCSGTYDGDVSHTCVTGGLVGAGLAVVNALSMRLEVETTRAGTRWTQAYERGEPVTALRQLGPASTDGTTIRFRPDPEIFANIEFDLARVAQRLQEIAWLNPLLQVWFQGRRLWGRGGLRRWLETMALNELIAPFSTHSRTADALVDVALGWTAGPETLLRSFANVQETRGGTHIEGLWDGLAACADKLGAPHATAASMRDVFSRGLVAIVHVGLLVPRMRYHGPLGFELESPEANMAVRHTLQTDLVSVLRGKPPLHGFLCDRLGITGR